MKHISSTSKTRHGKPYVFSSLPPANLLKQAGVSIGKKLHGKNYTKYLLVSRPDGDQVVFSLAALHSVFTDKQLLWAGTRAGASLPAEEEPFHLIVPGDKRPARSAHQVTNFVIRYAKD